MTLLYVLGTGSVWQDNELRYSLRSACAHVPHLKVAVVGHRPPWLVNVEHLPFGDMDQHPVANTAQKLRAAVRTGLVSDDFLLLNDDFLFLEDRTEHPAFVLGDLYRTVTQVGTKSAKHFAALAHSYGLLRKAGVLHAYDFESHHPLPMRKEHVDRMFRDHPITSQTYAWRSLYGNLFHDAVITVADVKLRQRFNPPRGTHFSYDDSVAADPAFRAWCEARWPHSCPYERT